MGASKRPLPREPATCFNMARGYNAAGPNRTQDIYTSWHRVPDTLIWAQGAEPL